MSEELDNDIMGVEFPEEDEFEEEVFEEERGNRTFMIIAGGLGVLLILAILTAAAYYFFGPDRRAQRATDIAVNLAQQTQLAGDATGTAETNLLMSQATNTPRATNTPEATPTSVLVEATATSVLAALANRTATHAALETQLAQTTLTPLAAVTALPDTGFMEDVGIPGLLGLAALALVVIFLVRRLRTATG